MHRFAAAAGCLLSITFQSPGLDSLNIIGLWSAVDVAEGNAEPGRGPGENPDGSAIIAAVAGGTARTDSTGERSVRLGEADSLLLQPVALYGDSVEIAVDFRIPRLGRDYELLRIRDFTILIDTAGHIRSDRGASTSDSIVEPGRWYTFSATIRWDPYVQQPPGHVGYSNVRISGYLDGVDVGQLHYPVLNWRTQTDSTVVIGTKGTDEGSGPYALDIAQFGLYRGLTDDDRLELCGWEPDPAADARDTVYVPAIVYQVLYDPPGDHSYAYLKQGSSFSTSMGLTMENSLGVSITAGGGFSIGDFGAGMEVTAGVEFTQKNDWETEVTITNQSEQRSDMSEDPEFIGPGQGDLVVYQAVAYLFRLYRRPKRGIVNPSSERDYDYFLGYRPLPSECEPIRYSSMSHFRSRFVDHPEFVAQIEALSAIDPATHRVRQGLIDSGKVTGQQVYEISGYQSESWSSAQSRTFTYSWDLTVSLEMAMKVSFFASVETKIKTSFTVGMSSSTSSEYTREIGYEFADNESWDVFRTVRYLDRRFGVYLFEVDSARSCASWPFEDAYAGRSVDWRFDMVDTADTAAAGDTIVFPIELTNTTGSNDPTVANLTIKSRIGSFAHHATMNAGAIMLPRDSTFRYDVKLSSPAAGTYPADIEFLFERPNDHNQFEVSVVRLYPTFLETKRGIAVTGDTMCLVPASVSGAVTREFTLGLKNLGEREVNLSTGISDHSPGVVYEYTTFPNPVEAGGSRNVNVRLTASADQIPCWVVFWAQAQEYPGVTRSVTLTIDTVGTGLVIGSPAAGDTLVGDSTCTIEWSSVGEIDSLVLYFSYNGGVDWMRAATIPDTGSFDWKVPAVFPSSTGAIKLAAATDETIAASVKPLVFSVVTGVVTPRVHRLRPGEVDFAPLPGGALRVRCGSPGVLSVYDCRGRLMKTLGVAGSSALWDGKDDSGSSRPAGACLLRWEAGGKRHVERVMLIR